MAGVVKKFSRGDVIIAEGSVGKSLYIVRSGRVEVCKNSRGGPVQLAVLGPNEVFGEMSLIDDRFSKRTASVRAIEPSEIVILDHEGFESYIRQASPGIFNLIKRLAHRLRETNDIISRAGADVQNLPQAIKLGEDEANSRKLTLDQIEEAKSAAVDLNLMPRKFRKGQVLFRENSDAMSMFMLKDGSVKVLKAADDGEIEVDSLVANEVVGEISMFEEGKRFFTARAENDGEAVVFSKQQMEEMLRKAPLELYLIMECLTQKLKRATLRFLEEHNNNVRLGREKAGLENSLAEARTEIAAMKEELERQQQKLRGLESPPGSGPSSPDTENPSG